MLKKETFLPSLILVLLLVVLGWVIVDRGSLDIEEQGIDKQDTQEEFPEIVSLVLDFGDTTEPQIQSIEIKAEETVLSVLKKALERLNIDLTIQEYEQGVFIEAIGNRKNGDDNKYWLYYVNGEMPQVSCGKKIVKAGDKIEFKFQTSPY